MLNTANNIFYKQIDDVSVEAPFGPALAKFFMRNSEKIWLKDCLYYTIFVFFSQHVHIY